MLIIVRLEQQCGLSHTFAERSSCHPTLPSFYAKHVGGWEQGLASSRVVLENTEGAHDSCGRESYDTYATRNKAQLESYNLWFLLVQIIAIV